MDKTRAAMQQALEAMEEVLIDAKWYAAKDALREALAEQAEQEPVAKYYGEKLVKGSKVFALLDRDLAPDTLLYAAPVRTKDLTDDEIESIMVEQGDLRTITFARAVIQADREKNKCQH